LLRTFTIMEAEKRQPTALMIMEEEDSNRHEDGLDEDEGDEGEVDEEEFENENGIATSLSVVVPNFPPLGPQVLSAKSKAEVRKIPVPPHRFTPVKNEWMKLYTPIVDQLKLQIRMNPKMKCIEIRTSPHTADISVLQKGADFLTAFMLGFAVDDAIALLRLEDLYIDSFDVQDVKTLHGEHLSRAIGRIAGKDGQTKFTIENVTKTRIVLADRKIHILGSFTNIKIARDAICDLILGSPPGKVYAKLRNIASRTKERF